ncbi:MAG: sulfatase, partial [Thermoanaerobaculia bacterium]
MRARFTGPALVPSAFWVAALLAALLGGCAPEDDGATGQPAGDPADSRGAASRPAPEPELPPPGAAAGYNLLLVTLDTTRADHLGAYGDAGAETPNLDRLAAGGLRFTDAVTPVPMTLPAHATLLTGLDPPGHGVRINGRFVLGQEHETLAEALRRAGYETAAFVSSFVLDRRFGLAQGFDRYDARLETTRAAAFAPQTERSAEAVTDAAVEWLEGRRAAGGEGRPVFLWVHYFDPHDPYEPPEPFASRFADRPYAGEIAYVDRELGRLLASLERTGLAGRTVVVATADHGESLGEHGERYHSRTLYEGAVRVPLI